MWNNIDNYGLDMLSHIPKELVKNKNDQSMIVELINGSMIQVIWTDRKIDNIVGTNPVGVLFSEYPISDPRWWDLLRPILKGHRKVIRDEWRWIIWLWKEDTKNRVHPTQKPVSLINIFINEWGKDAKLVVDIFWWSGSTMVACHQINRKCYMSELDCR